MLHRTSRQMAAALLLLPLQVLAQPVPEYELKAAFVYNFALFTDWPGETNFEGGTLNICVNPGSAMRQSLGGLQDKPAKGRRIAVRPVSTVDSIRACHVLFVDAVDRDRWTQMKKTLAGASVLTVTDDDEISHEGSVVTLVTHNSRVAFDIDLRAARAARLVLSSKLLRLARAVQ